MPETYADNIGITIFVFMTSVVMESSHQSVQQIPRKKRKAIDFQLRMHQYEPIHVSNTDALTLNISQNFVQCLAPWRSTEMFVRPAQLF